MRPLYLIPVLVNLLTVCVAAGYSDQDDVDYGFQMELFSKDKTWQVPTPAPDFTDPDTVCNMLEYQAIVKGNAPDLCLERASFCLQNPPLIDTGSSLVDTRDVYDQYGPTREVAEACASDPRYFILSVGPPASGKSSVIHQHIYPQLGIDPNDPSSIINVDVDKFTEPKIDPNVLNAFREEIGKIRRENEKAGDHRLDKYFKQLLNDAGRRAFVPYSEARRAHGDTAANFPMYEMFIAAEGDPCKRKHVLFESTLSSPGSFHWAIKVARVAKRAGLIPVVVYPFTFRHRLYHQAMVRGADSGRLPAPSEVKGMAVGAFRHAVAIARHMRYSNDPDFQHLFLIDNSHGSPEQSVVLLGIHHSPAALD